MQTVAISTAATQDDGQPRGSRLLYFDNLRTALTALVVVHHAAIAYSDIPMWYYIEPVHDHSAIALDILLVFDQMFFMGFFFLISGYFVPSSYDRKGGGKYLRDRLIRLGIPLVLFAIVLSPILLAGHYSLAKVHEAADGISLPYWKFYQHSISPGPMWFVELLLVFCAIYVLARRTWGGARVDQTMETGRIGWRAAIGTILGYALALAAITYLWRIVVPVGQTWPIVGLPTPTYLPQYATLFVVGLIASRRGWAQCLPVPAGWFGLALLAGAIAMVPIIAVAFGRKSVATAWTGVESLAAVGIIAALFVLFRQRFNHQGQLARFMSNQAYTVYFIHPLVLVALNHACKGLHASSVGKFIIVAALAIPLCWISAYVVRSLPYAKRVL